MVVVALYFKAALENIQLIECMSNIEWCFDVKQSNSEEIRERVTLSEGATYAIPNSRGTANFLIRWDGAKHFSTINITQVKGINGKYCSDDNTKLVPVVAFECRGVEPCRWYPSHGWRVTTIGGKIFEDVDLSEDWCEYDEKKKVPVSICNVMSELKVLP